jgi:cytochrome b561
LGTDHPHHRQVTLGFFRIVPMANADPQKISLLRTHIIVGIVILALTIIRFIARLSTAKPPAASTGHPALARLATLAHYAFYLLVVLMATTGIATAMLSGLGASVFGDSGAALPPSFLVYPPRVAHGVIAIALASITTLVTLCSRNQAISWRRPCVELEKVVRDASVRTHASTLFFAMPIPATTKLFCAIIQLPSLLGSGSKPMQLFGLRKTPELSLALLQAAQPLGATGLVPATGGRLKPPVFTF